MQEAQADVGTMENKTASTAHLPDRLTDMEESSGRSFLWVVPVAAPPLLLLSRAAATAAIAAGLRRSIAAAVAAAEPPAPGLLLRVPDGNEGLL
jgi:hypothetical protein